MINFHFNRIIKANVKSIVSTKIFSLKRFSFQVATISISKVIDNYTNSRSTFSALSLRRDTTTRRVKGSYWLTLTDYWKTIR